VKLFFTLVSLISFASCFSQWTRIGQLPSTDIASLYHKDNILYAGGKNVIYISKNNGSTWDSTSAIPQLFLVTSIIIYKNELYAAAPHKDVFKSSDGGTTWQGTTWQGMAPGAFPDVADFCEFRGDLYAATFGNSVYKLDPVNDNNWLPFSNGLSDLSANLPVIASNSNAIIAGTLANGIYDHLTVNSTIWQERLLTGQIDPNEGAYAIVAAHDTLFYSGRTGKFYMSTDNGLNWNFIGDRLASAATSLVNAKQAILLSRHVFEGSFKTLFYYIKKDSLQSSFVNFSVVTDSHFTYKIDILGNRLWDASNKGLFFTSLSDLPGISATDDAGTPIILPVHFISINARCQESKELISWKTDHEQSSDHFSIERSVDGASWTAIGVQQPLSNSGIENHYSFTDTDPVQNSFYRIGHYDLNGKVQYSAAIRSSCQSTDVFTSVANPFREKLLINIVTAKPLQVLLKIFDNRGSLVTMKKAAVLPGRNEQMIDMKLYPAGTYYLSTSWNGGQTQKVIQVLKL
jgi:hypothetical protein